MPLPESLTRFNRRFANPVMKQIARRFPLMGIVIHHGRNSGRRYETPVLAFPEEAAVTFALTYGSDVDWLKNVQAAGGCTLIYRGRERKLTDPRMLSTSEGRQRMPAFIWTLLRLIHVDDFLELTKCPSDAQAGSDG